MSIEKFQEDCPGCRPAIMDLQTMKPLPVDHPAMIAINEIWNKTTVHERVAWHAFTCQNARDPLTMAIIPGLQNKFEKALECVL